MTRPRRDSIPLFSHQAFCVVLCFVCVSVWDAVATSTKASCLSGFWTNETHLYGFWTPHNTIWTNLLKHLFIYLFIARVAKHNKLRLFITKTYLDLIEPRPSFLEQGLLFQ